MTPEGLIAAAMWGALATVVAGGYIGYLRIEVGRQKARAERAKAHADQLYGEGVNAMAERLLQETNLRSLDFRNGMAMDIVPARALSANFVGAARAMLGDAENYSETPVEMEFSLGVDPDNPAPREKFAFIVQRVAPGKLTPHQARQKAEKRAERAEAALEDVLGRLAQGDDPDDILRGLYGPHPEGQDA